MRRLGQFNTSMLRTWNLIRPWWHIATFLIVVSFLASAKWSKIELYDARLMTVEEWRIAATQAQVQQTQDLAVMAQQLKDIHDYLLPPRTASNVYGSPAH